jgi:hypothetical protein
MYRRACSLALVATFILSPIASRAASVEKVHEFFEVMGLHKMLLDMLPAMTNAMVNGMKQGNPNLPADVPDIISKVVTDTIMPLLPEMQKASEKLYADSLTDEEVTGAITFYKTPVGQSLLRKLPAITQQGMQIGQTIMQGHIPELQRRLRDELQKRHPEIK